MRSQLLVDPAEFERLCDEIRDAGIVSFDTEFVSESTYQPELGLLQFATPERCVAVDPYKIKRLDPWWALMADQDTTVVVHAGQAEVRFCLKFCGRRPGKLVDVQIAEGLRGGSYPLGYSTLVKRVVGRTVHGKETRTDWRRRPLTERQIRYALDDVQELLPIWERQRKWLVERNRLPWAEAEFQQMIDDVEAESSHESWMRVSGLHKLNARELASARELIEWREQEAARRDRPLRTVLRDDLILELARRQPRNFQELTALRDLKQPRYKKLASQLLRCIERGLAVPESQLPPPLTPPSRTEHKNEQILGQLLGIALADRCVEMNVARSLVATRADLNQLVRWSLEKNQRGSRPRLTQGWRAEVCGQLLTDVLQGKVALRVANPHSDYPIAFERINADR